MMLRRLQDAAVSVLRYLPGTTTLRIQPGVAGFFGEVFLTLNGIRTAEMHRMGASVMWGPSSPYFEPGLDANAWTAFFQSAVFDFSDKRPRGSLRIPYRPGGHDFIPYDGLGVRQSVGHALKRWCRPQLRISDTVEAFKRTNFRPEGMLGVHVRLTDAARGVEGRASIGMPLIIQAVDGWLSNNPDAGIFLAADENRVIHEFTQRYRGKVVFQECLRSPDGRSIHGHYDDGILGSPYRKGAEVLADAMLLSNCDYLIRTHSRVTAFSLCWNLGLRYRDLEREVLGIDRTPWLHV